MDDDDTLEAPVGGPYWPLNTLLNVDQKARPNKHKVWVKKKSRVTSIVELQCCEIGETKSLLDTISDDSAVEHATQRLVVANSEKASTNRACIKEKLEKEKKNTRRRKHDSRARASQREEEDQNDHTHM